MYRMLKDQVSESRKLLPLSSFTFSEFRSKRKILFFFCLNSVNWYDSYCHYLWHCCASDTYLIPFDAVDTSERSSKLVDRHLYATQQHSTSENEKRNRHSDRKWNKKETFISVRVASFHAKQLLNPWLLPPQILEFFIRKLPTVTEMSEFTSH